MLRKVFFLLTLILAMVGCRGALNVSPTPFPTPEPTATIGASGPIALTVPELLNASGVYRDTMVQLTGQLRKAPLIVCDSEYYASPVSWGLGEEGLTAYARGFDDQVRTLLPNDLIMTIEGRWQRWEGTVGCGKQARTQEVWFIDVSRILSPNPLTQITAPPSAGGGVAAIPTVQVTLPSSGGMSEIEATKLAESGVKPSETPAVLKPTEPPKGDLYPSGGDSDQIPTISPLQTTITDTASIPEQTGTTTSPPGSGSLPGDETKTPEPSAGPGGIIDRGDVYDAVRDRFTTSSIPAGVIDSWRYEMLSEDDVLYFHAIAPPPADIILSVYKNGEAIIQNQNKAPAGSPESLIAPNLPGPGIYEIRVSTKGSVATDYGLTIYDDPRYPVTIGGVIRPGDPQKGVNLPARAIHVWFFTSRAGDSVGIRLKPLGEYNIAADLYRPRGIFLSTIDTGYEGEEEYREVTLPETGLNAIRVFEYYALEAMNYDIEISNR